MTMHPETTLEEQVSAALKMRGLRPVCVAEAAPHLNEIQIHDPQGKPWTPCNLRSYLDTHGIRPEVVPDLSHFVFVECEHAWNGRSILRTIERGPDAAEDALQQAIVDDPEVCRDVIGVCVAVNDDPYRAGLYRRWLDFARQQDASN